jgi:hypothetical protein
VSLLFLSCTLVKTNLQRNMADQPSVRSAYANLVTVLAKSFPNNCAHLKKLPRTQNIISDWQVLLNNPRVAARDVALFHQPPLSALGLSRLQKEGKLTPKSTSHIWEYVDLVLESLLPPVEVPSPYESQLMQLVSAQAQAGGDPKLGNLLTTLLGGLQANPDVTQLLKGITESKDDGAGNPAGPAGLADMISKLGSNPAFASILLKLKAQFSTNPDLERLANQLQSGGPESILNFANAFKHRLDAGELGEDSLPAIFQGLMGGEGGGAGPAGVQNILDQLPENFKTKLTAFGEQVAGQEGNTIANALGLMGSHFDQDDLTNVAEVLIPHLSQMIPAATKAM